MAFVNPQKIVDQLEIEPGMEVADFGAGAGHYVVLLSQLVGADGKVYAVEIQPELLTKARSLATSALDNVEFLQGDIGQVEGSQIAREAVDLVLLSNTLFQLDDKEAALREAFRVLRRGGRLVVIEWSDSFGGLGPPPEQIVDRDQILAMAEEVGFQIEGEIDADEHHWAVKLEK